MATTTTIGALSSTIEDRLARGIRESLPRLDPVWKMFHDSYMGVTRSDIGQSGDSGFQVKHTFNESLHGAFRWVNQAGADDVVSDRATTWRVQGTIQTYPTITDSVMPGYVQTTVTLVEGMGNLFVPQHYLRANKLEASIGDVVLDLVKGAAQLTALAEIGAWYNTSTTKSVLCSIGENSSTAASHEVNVKGAINILYPGMPVDIWDGTIKNNSTTWVVDAVTYLPTSSDTGYGTVVIKSRNGSEEIDVDSGDLITTANSNTSTGSTLYGPTSPFTWLVSTGSPFSLNVGTHPQFQSVNVSSVGDLDETKLNRYFARLWKAYGTLNFPDCVLTSMGVTTALLDSSYGLADRFNRDLGQRNKLVMGFDEAGPATYKFNSIPLHWFESPYMPSDSAMDGTTNGGRLLAFKTRDKNIMRYLPPPLNARKHSLFGSECEFLFGGDGGGAAGSIFSAMHSNPSGTTVSKTEWFEAPFNRFCEYAPKYMPGLQLSDVTEIL